MVARLGDPGGAALPERLAAAVAWADAVLAGGDRHGPEVVERLRAHFSEPEIMELTYAIATFIGYAKVIITLGCEPEPGVLPVTVVPTPGA